MINEEFIQVKIKYRNGNVWKMNFNDIRELNEYLNLKYKLNENLKEVV